MRQEYWSGLPFPPPGDLPNPRFQPASPALAGRFFTTEPLGSPVRYIIDEEMQLHSFVGVFVFGHVFCGILVPRPGIEPPPLALASRSHNHWTAEEVPETTLIGFVSPKAPNHGAHTILSPLLPLRRPRVGVVSRRVGQASVTRLLSLPLNEASGAGP